MQVLFCGIVKLSIYTTWDHLWCPTKSMIRERVNEHIARSWCAKMLQNWTIWKKKSNMWMSGCLSYIDIVSGTLYTIYCHWLCDIWVMISKFYGWKWIVPMDHGYRVHLPCQNCLQIHMLKKIQCRWPLLWLFKTSASEGVCRLMEGRWLRVETHFQRTHLSWCADFAGNDLQNYKCKGQNGQNHQANRDITYFFG